MKNILFINYEYPPIGAGAANAGYYFALNMKAQNINVCVLTSAYKSLHGRTIEDGVTVYRINAFRTRKERSSIIQMLIYIISALIHLPFIIRKERPDVLIVFFGFPGGPIGLAVRLFRKIPYILLLRGGDVPGSEPELYFIHKLLTPLRRIIYKKSIAVAANSEGLRELALKSDPLSKIHVVPNGVDTSFFCPSEKSVPEQNHFNFIFAGRFCEQKNIETLINAFSKCLSLRPAATLILTGDGHSYSRLKSLSASLNIDRYIQWPGWVNKTELKNFYLSSHCFVNPSVGEGMPNAVLEAMSCGLPVIGSNCIGNREIIIDGETGFLVESYNVEELLNRMILLFDNRQLCRKLGAKGRKLCVERYSWAAAAEKLCLLINKNLNRECLTT